MSQTQEDTVIKFDMHQNIQSVLQLKQMRGRGRGNPHKRFVADKFLTSKISKYKHTKKYSQTCLHASYHWHKISKYRHSDI